MGQTQDLKPFDVEGTQMRKCAKYRPQELPIELNHVKQVWGEAFEAVISAENGGAVVLRCEAEG